MINLGLWILAGSLSLLMVYLYLRLVNWLEKYIQDRFLVHMLFGLLLIGAWAFSLGVGLVYAVLQGLIT